MDDFKRINKIVNENPSKEFLEEMGYKSALELIELIKRDKGFIFVSGEGHSLVHLNGLAQVIAYKVLIEKIIPTLEEDFKSYKDEDMVSFLNKEIKFPKNHTFSR